MSTAAVLPSDHEQSHGAPPATCKFGMIIFLISEAMLFAGLIAGYIVLRGAVPGEWPPPGAPDITVNFLKLDFMNVVMLINSAILISSSVTLHYSEVAVQKHGRSGLALLLLTIVLGSIFLSIQAYEWFHLHHEGMWFDTYGVYGSSFFVTTGFHGMHVFIGILLLVWCFLKQVFTRCFTPARHAALNNVSLYWHFVDGVWIVVYSALYII